MSTEQRSTDDDHPTIVEQPHAALARAILRAERARQYTDLDVQYRDGTARISLQAAARDRYDKDELPETVRSYYIPELHGVFVDLPDPDPDQSSLDIL